MTRAELCKANELLGNMTDIESQLTRIKKLIHVKYNMIAGTECSPSNPFIKAALNYERVTLEQRLRMLEKEFAEL